LFIPRGDMALFKTSEAALYDLSDYPERFEDPAKMFASELSRAELMLDWPTDGIPTVRPNLGTIFVPACVGQEYEVRPGNMPWPAGNLSKDAIRAIELGTIAQAALMGRAETFYSLARERRGVVAYHADTQGVFDIAHLLYGDELFIDMATDEGQPWARELIDRALEVYLSVSDHLKSLLGERPGEMIHGHATPQGLYFPHAGVRISEDTATLISPEMIREFLEDPITKSMEPYGGGFVHYCGKHEPFYEFICEHPLVRAIDLGNPELYDVDWLAEIASRTGTVLYTRLPSLEGEGWDEYVTRLGHTAQSSGARMVLRATVYPDTRTECRDMLAMWHDVTDLR